jgi:hypothetical protein
MPPNITHFVDVAGQRINRFAMERIGKSILALNRKESEQSV